MNCGVGCRCSSYPELLWLWRGPAPTAPTVPLAWEPPYAAGIALKRPKKKKKKKKYPCTEMFEKNLLNGDDFSELPVSLFVCVGLRGGETHICVVYTEMNSQNIFDRWI